MKKDIYMITNNINGKIYIGQAKDTKVRFQSHCKPSAAYLNNELVGKAIQKYGKDNFTITILEAQIENYDEREQYWIQFYNSKVPNGYNIADGGCTPNPVPGHLHPESILTEEKVLDLTNDLLKSSLNFKELAEKYGFSSNTSIVDFNNGKTYFREDVDYPIRKEVLKGKLTKKEVAEIISILKTTYRSFEDIGKEYQVEARTISRINKGEYHKKEEEIYPIREGKLGNHLPKLTYIQVSEIIELLQSTKISLREIARRYDCDYRDILGIKNGTTKLYRRRGLTYPLRANN